MSRRENRSSTGGQTGSYGFPRGFLQTSDTLPGCADRVHHLSYRISPLIVAFTRVLVTYGRPVDGLDCTKITINYLIDHFI